MRLRGILVLAIALALTFTTVLAVQAGEGKGKVVRLDSAANVVILDDGSMYRMAPDTVIIVEEKPVKCLESESAVSCRTSLRNEHMWSSPVRDRSCAASTIGGSATPCRL